MTKFEETVNDDGSLRQSFHVEGVGPSGRTWPLDDAITCTKEEWASWTDDEKEAIVAARLANSIAIWEAPPPPPPETVQIIFAEVDGNFVIGEIARSNSGASASVQGIGITADGYTLTLGNIVGSFGIGDEVVGDASQARGTISG